MVLPAVRTVLVVDDDTSIRILLKTILKRRGFHILEARNGREALDQMRAGNVDLVVMDLMMPEVSGWDVLRERASDAILLAIPMIIVSANQGADVRLLIADCSVAAVVSKPFDLVNLVGVVTACLSHIAPMAA